MSNLRSAGYTVVGPVLEDGVVCLDEVVKAEDMAAGVVDAQAPGVYKTRHEGNQTFSAVNGPHSPKRYLHPGEVRLMELGPELDRREQEANGHASKKYAFLGIRPCDLRAVRTLDGVLMVPGFEDSIYTPLREASILIAVNCARAGENCFCASMGTGPKASEGFDMALTELPGGILVETKTEYVSLLDGIELRSPMADELQQEKRLMEHVVSEMHKKVALNNLTETMIEKLDSPVWSAAAERCLSCGNCTMVCPTCFCYSIKDVSDLNDGSVARVRVWDSCLSKEFTYAAGGNPRRERKARYRQFVMHKFAYWPEQFGVYGCVGCGRCITWCPVGIDITETVNGVLRGPAASEPRTEAVKAG